MYATAVGSFLRRLYVGDQQRLHADVEKAFDQHHVVPRRAHDGRGRVGRSRLQLGDHVLQIIGRVLGVEQQPVEAGAGDDLDAVVGRQAGPQPDLRLSRFHAALELVDWQFHLLLRRVAVSVGFRICAAALPAGSFVHPAAVCLAVGDGFERRGFLGELRAGQREDLFGVRQRHGDHAVGIADDDVARVHHHAAQGDRSR